MLNTTKQKSINEISKKYNLDKKHAQQVKKLSLLLFDKTYDYLHNFSEIEKGLLEAAALLHDIGHFISTSEHHKHTYILIKQENPQGFTPEEIEIIANIARYHKGKPPKEHHNCYAQLTDKKSQNIVKKLSTFLRLADSLDKSRRSIIEDLDCLYDSFSQTLFIVIKSGNQNISLELSSANERKTLFEDEFGIQIEFKII